MDRDVAVFMNYRRLRHLTRCNNFHKVSSEDVAQHSYYVAMLAMIITDELKEKGKKLDELLILRKALLHDVSEAVTGDIPHNVKKYVEFTVDLEGVLTNIAGEYYTEGVSGRFGQYALWESSCKYGDSGEVVALVDMLELAVYCYEETLLGNKVIIPLYEKAIRLVKEIPIYRSSEFAQSLVSSMENGESDFQFL